MIDKRKHSLLLRDVRECEALAKSALNLLMSALSLQVDGGQCDIPSTAWPKLYMPHMQNYVSQQLVTFLVIKLAY